MAETEQNRAVFPRQRSSESARQSGSVLIAVLGIIFLLSALIVQFMDEAVRELEYRSLFNEPPELRSTAFSVLETSLAVIHEVALINDGKLYAPEQGWGDPLAYADLPLPDGWEVEVSIRDESAKLPINTMEAEALNRLLEESLDFDFGTARELSSTLLDWIDADDDRRLNGAESNEYLSRDPPYRAANGPLQSLRELRLLEVWDELFFDADGQPNAAFRRLASLVSVLNAQRVNLNSAPRPLIDLLALSDGYDGDRIFDGLEEPYLTAPPPAANTRLSGVEINLLRVDVTVRRGNIPFTLSALVEPVFSGETGGGATAGSSRGRPPGRANAGDEPKTGSVEEQEAMGYPFRILQLSEYRTGRAAQDPARHSAVDISRESDSF